MVVETLSSTNNTKLLPILIIPGLCSSGLECQESDQIPGWERKRLWLNLSSIGISAMYFGKAQYVNSEDDIDDDDDGNDDRQQGNYKSSWLNHMFLAPDHESDPPGIKVRPILGLEGVDYLTPGFVTGAISYVFGPVIEMLKEKGYNSGGKTNLMASPYDWRLAPRTMEKRDKYFTVTLNYIEMLYNNNDSTPVVLLCHSLGCKVGHYLLNFALNTKGQDWIDKYVHTYMPLGAPHLGAPKAMRGQISGMKMSLDTFLSDEEGLSLSRSVGVLPWMMPQHLPDGVPGTNYILQHGVLNVSFVHAVDVDTLVAKRTAASRPKRYQLLIKGDGFDGTRNQSQREVRTPFYKISPDHGANVVMFNDKISFATSTEPYYNETLQFLLQEPGLASAKKEKKKCGCNPFVWVLCCLCFPCMLVYKILEFFLCGLVQGATITADAIAGNAGTSSTLAFSENIKIPKSVWSGKEVTIKVLLHHRDDFGQFEGCGMSEKSNRQAVLFVKLKWKTFDPTLTFRKLCSPICRPSPDATQLPITRNDEKYEEFTGYDVMEREGLDDAMRFIKNVYDGDTLGPRSLSSVDPPPINRIHAIYGINLPTEVGCVYSRQDTCISEGRLQSFYVPNRKATIDKRSGYEIYGGLIRETPKTKQEAWDGIEVCGDGTVPYWSLAHAKTWQSAEREVTVVELEKAEHRAILADSRLHEAILDYVCIDTSDESKW